MKKLSQILIDSQDTRKQTYGNFVIGNPHHSQNVPEKYCAIGAIMCEAGLIKYVHDANVSMMEVFQALNLPNKAYSQFLRRIVMKCPNIGKIKHAKPHYNFHSHYSMIIHLNDYHHASFKEIGEWLKKEGF